MNYFKNNQKSLNNKKLYIFRYFRNELGLSKKESEVAFLAVLGYKNKEICKKLKTKEKTVKFHLTNIFRRLEIEKRSQLILTLPIRIDF